jgi:iron complex outermembrane receptor protein
MLRLSCLLVGWLWASALCSEGSAQVEASDDSLKTYEIDEVVTTGTRTSKRIIDVPYSIERIDNTQYKFDRKVSVSDVLGSVPGLFMQSRYGNHDVRISIRGFGSRSNSGIRGVRILLDGIPESEPDGQTRIEAIDFQSVGKIEIVKGNSSSLYTNAPGGVINFINDIDFANSFAVNFNEFGSFDLRSNGFKAGVRTEKYGFLMTYNYHNAKGYRPHSADYWHIMNTVLETTPGDNSSLQLYGYFVDGFIRLPGSLTKEQFEADAFQANARDISRDSKRITKKGRIGLRFSSFLDEDKRHQVEVTGYGTIKYFERTAATYRVIDREGLGASGRWVFHTRLFNLPYELSLGGDLLYQAGPEEEYENLNGRKGDNLEAVTDAALNNVGAYFQNSLNLVDERLDLLFTGRYDKVIFDSKNRILEVTSAVRRFEAFTPKVALNYKFTPTVAAYTSYGLSYDSPAGNEMDNHPESSKPTVLLNPDLLPQKSINIELGVKGNLLSPESEWFRNLYFEVTFFRSMIEDEIVPFEVYGDVFFRNSAKTNRTGLEAGASLEVFKGLKLKSAYTLSDFTYESYTARTIELDTSANIVTKDRDFTGNVVPSVPKHNLSLTLSYERKLLEYITGFVKVNYVNVSGMFTDDENSDKTKGYQLVNATLGVDASIDRFNMLISGGVNNISNLTYAAFININSASKQFYEAGEPQNFYGGISLGYSF